MRIRETYWVEHLKIFDELELKTISIVRWWIIKYDTQVFHTKNIPQNIFIGEDGINMPKSLIRSLCRLEIVEPEMKPKCLHRCLTSKTAFSSRHQMTVDSEMIFFNVKVFPKGSGFTRMAET